MIKEGGTERTRKVVDFKRGMISASVRSLVINRYAGAKPLGFIQPRADNRRGLLDTIERISVRITAFVYDDLIHQVHCRTGRYLLVCGASGGDWRCGLGDVVSGVSRCLFGCFFAFFGELLAFAAASEVAFLVESL